MYLLTSCMPRNLGMMFIDIALGLEPGLRDARPTQLAQSYWITKVPEPCSWNGFQRYKVKVEIARER